MCSQGVGKMEQCCSCRRINPRVGRETGAPRFMRDLTARATFTERARRLFQLGNIARAVSFPEASVLGSPTA